MDVKTTLLNDYPDESIYMMQPYDFTARVKGIWYTSCINPFMDQSKHLVHETNILIK